MRRTFRFGVEYLASPIFDPSDATMGHVSPETLGVPADLSAAIRVWDDAYQQTLDQNYPPDSRSFTPSELGAHNRQGAELADRLQQALGQNFTIHFVPLAPDA